MANGGADVACYTLISPTNESKQYTEQKLREDLQNENVIVKREALKELIRNSVNGEKYRDLLMIVIRFVMPSNDHTTKKLLHLFWEVAPKYSPQGKLLNEMILVCDAYRRDLQHPNEYIRGCTLRFLCKLKEPELLEPLMPSILQCLEHRHAYVRRNAVLAIFTIYKNFEHLIPDAPERMLNYLEEEQDPSCKRNAFLMLLHVSQDTAVQYLSRCIDAVDTFSETMQLVVVELIHRVFQSHPLEKVNFIRCVFSLLNSTSSSVRYEAATTLITLSGASAAIRASASCYIDLILKESDNNAKLVILNSLIALRARHEKILQELVMDVVRILNASDVELRNKALELIVDLATTRTVDDLTGFLRKELIKSSASASSGSAASSTESGNGSLVKTGVSDEDVYRHALVRTIRAICMKFPNCLPAILPTLCDILTYAELKDSMAAIEICRFLRDAVFRHPHHRSLILEKVFLVLPSVAGFDVLRHLIWLCGEFCTAKSEILEFLLVIHQCIGPLPIVQIEMSRIMTENGSTGEENMEDSTKQNSGVPAEAAVKKVTVDGAYATQSAFTIRSEAASTGDVKRPVIQAALFANNFTIGSVVSVCLVKLFCHFVSLLDNPDTNTSATEKNRFSAECMLIISSMIHLACSGLVACHVNSDIIDRMWTCLVALADSRTHVMCAFGKIGRDFLKELLDVQEAETKKRIAASDNVLSPSSAETNSVDASIDFELLVPPEGDQSEQVDHFTMTLDQAIKGTARAGDAYATSKLKKVHQLTGLSDPVYAEAFVSVNQFDIALDVLLVNQTKDTLQNLTLELSTLGDHKLIEKPRPITLAAQDFANVCATIKVSSTENGIIFGNIVYDTRGSAGESNCIVLSDIRINILEYIQPSTCSDADFRSMWSDFDWENKVTVSTQLTDLRAYLDHVTKITNFKCLTPPEALRGECNYLCATLYARSIFGEHVLGNLCLEKSADGAPVSGHVRIRAKTQGMAVTMGDKISTSQKQWKDEKPLNASGSNKNLVEDTSAEFASLIPGI
ncbi:Coatomer subunit beta [Echinococcus multilocularis]|uniref:Coatomer subunit beta n=1 Tax=Echinococcus multilocularis TaxID=6211 RepID=A0A068Y5X9_ECHMU|nr:Coatomer subunit beta [Echinococcus multilocularis]